MNPESNTAPKEPLPLHRHAEENLVYIRDAIARSQSFTAVSGWGLIAMGLIAAPGSWVATRRTEEDGWLYAWAAIGFVACAVGVIAMCVKAYVRKMPLWVGAGRRFVLSFSPPILVGCVLTEALYQNHLDFLMPAVWLMLYGVAVISGGAYSVRPVPLMGLAFVVLGVFAAFYPLHTPVIGEAFLLRDAVLAFAFGGLHIVLGAIIATRYGG